MSMIGGYNPRANRLSASQQVMALQGSLPPVPQPNVNTILNPLFGRPDREIHYTPRQSTPQAGPIPKTSVGSGRTGAASDRSTGFLTPGHVSEQEDYQPVGLDNEPIGIDAFSQPHVPPRSINAGTNGRDLVGTYNPHDSTPADRFINMWRSAHIWYSPVFGPSWRNLLVWQQAAKYNLYTQLAQSRGLSQSDYFIGYQTNTDMSLSGSAMGASGGSLGYR